MKKLDRVIGRTDTKGRIVVFKRFNDCYYAAMGIAAASFDLKTAAKLKQVKAKLEGGLLKEQEAIELL